MELLALFDVDGTLLVSDDPLVGRATNRAIEDVYGIQLPDNAIRGVDHAGRTSLWITREMLRNHGLAEDVIADGLQRWCATVSARYAELLDGVDASYWRAPPGTADAVAEVEAFARCALLTGNPEPIARTRMERLGLGGFFPQGQGAFGCDADERAELIALARRRAGGWPAAGTVEIGDTPRDVEGAKEAGVLSVAVLWGRFQQDELAGADAFIGSMAELPGVLRRLGEAAG